MQSAKEKSRTLFENGTAILMARLVDASGTPIQPATIRAIDCTIYEIDPCWPHSLTLVTGYDAVYVAVANVVFDSLQIDELWTVDDLGYNFRHEITRRWPSAVSQSGFSVSGEISVNRPNGMHECTIVRCHNLSHRERSRGIERVRDRCRHEQALTAR